MRERKGLTLIPEDWRPDPERIKACAGLVPCIVAELDRFRDYYLSRGIMMRDWHAAFRNWLRKAAEMNAARAPTVPVERESHRGRYEGYLPWRDGPRDRWEASQAMKKGRLL